MCSAKGHVRFTLESGHSRCKRKWPPSAISGHRPHSIISWGLSAIIELLMFMPVPNSGHMTPANKTGHRERVNHLFRLLRRWPSRVIRLTSVSSPSGFCTAVLAMLQLAPWFFGLLAGAIFGIIVGYLDPHSSDASLFGAVGVFAYTWLWFAQSTKSSSH